MVFILFFFYIFIPNAVLLFGPEPGEENGARRNDTHRVYHFAVPHFPLQVQDKIAVPRIFCTFRSPLFHVLFSHVAKGTLEGTLKATRNLIRNLKINKDTYEEP